MPGRRPRCVPPRLQDTKNWVNPETGNGTEGHVPQTADTQDGSHRGGGNVGGALLLRNRSSVIVICNHGLHIGIVEKAAMCTSESCRKLGQRTPACPCAQDCRSCQRSLSSRPEGSVRGTFRL